MKENKANLNNQDVLFGAFIGAVTGAIVALLWAPKSGQELRTDLSRNASNLRDRADDWKDTASDKGSELKEKAYLKGSDLRTKAVDSTIDLSRKTQQKTQELAANIQSKITNDPTRDETAVTNEGEGTEGTTDRP